MPSWRRSEKAQASGDSREEEKKDYGEKSEPNEPKFDEFRLAL